MKKTFMLVDYINGGKGYFADTEEEIVELAIELRNNYEDDGYDVEATLSSQREDMYVIYER